MELSLLVNCAAQLACEAGAGPDENSELWCCSVLNLMRHSATPVSIAASEGSPSNRKNPLRAIFEMRARLEDSPDDDSQDSESCDQPRRSPKDKFPSNTSSSSTTKSEPRTSAAPFLLSQVCLPVRTPTTLLHSTVDKTSASVGEVDTPPIKGKAPPAFLGFPERASASSRRRKQASPSASSDKSSSSPCSKWKKFACGFPGCGKTFGQTNHLQAHRRLHTGERPFVCTHPGCDKAFTQTGHLTAHLRIHTGERPYACSFPGCHKRFTQSTNMRMHLRVHGGCEEVDDSAEGQVPCRFHGCSRKFASRRGMETHVRSVHMAMLKSSSSSSLVLPRDLRPKSTRGSKRRHADSSEDDYEEDSFEEDAYSDE